MYENGGPQILKYVIVKTIFKHQGGSENDTLIHVTHKWFLITINESTADKIPTS